MNLTDPSGEFPNYCRRFNTKEAYANCVKSYYNLTPTNNGGTWDLSGVTKLDGCLWGGPIPYKADGYIEGGSAFAAVGILGEEIVYDFATMERQRFTYKGGGVGIENSLLALGAIKYYQIAHNFRSNSPDGIKEYQGLSMSYYLGFSPMKFTSVGTIFSKAPYGEIWALGAFMGVGASTPPSPKEEIDI